VLTLLFVLGILALIGVGLWLHARSNVRLAEQHMAGREAFAASDFGHQFFSERQAPVAARLRELLASETSIQLERMRPEDRPVHDLKIDELDSLAITEFLIAVEKDYGIELPETETARIRTFRDVVELVCRQLDGARTA